MALANPSPSYAPPLLLPNGLILSFMSTWSWYYGHFWGSLTDIVSNRTVSVTLKSLCGC